MLPGSTDSAEIRGLEGGVSYAVRVTALVGDREGAPVSIVVTTRRPGRSGWSGAGTGARGQGDPRLAWPRALGAGPRGGTTSGIGGGVGWGRSVLHSRPGIGSWAGWGGAS